MRYIRNSFLSGDLVGKSMQTPPLTGGIRPSFFANAHLLCLTFQSTAGDLPSVNTRSSQPEALTAMQSSTLPICQPPSFGNCFSSFTALKEAPANGRDNCSQACLAKSSIAEQVNDFRPIVIFSLIYRTWAAIRCDLLRQVSPLFCRAGRPLSTGTPSIPALRSQRSAALASQASPPTLVKAFNSLTRLPTLAIASHVGAPQSLLAAWPSFSVTSNVASKSGAVSHKESYPRVARRRLPDECLRHVLGRLGIPPILQGFSRCHSSTTLNSVRVRPHSLPKAALSLEGTTSSHSPLPFQACFALPGFLAKGSAWHFHMLVEQHPHRQVAVGSHSRIAGQQSWRESTASPAPHWRSGGKPRLLPTRQRGAGPPPHLRQAATTGQLLPGPFSKLLEVFDTISWTIINPPLVLDHDGVPCDQALAKQLRRPSMHRLQGMDLPLCRLDYPRLIPHETAMLSAIQDGPFRSRVQHAHYDTAKTPDCVVPDTYEHQCRYCPADQLARSHASEVTCLWDSLPACFTNHLLVPRNPWYHAYRELLHQVPDLAGRFEGPRPAEGQLQHLFTDGSCSTYCEGFTVAAWVVVSATTSVCISSGPLVGFPQTITRAELSAFCSACQWVRLFSSPPSSGRIATTYVRGTRTFSPVTLTCTDEITMTFGQGQAILFQTVSSCW